MTANERERHDAAASRPRCCPRRRPSWSSSSACSRRWPSPRSAPRATGSSTCARSPSWTTCASAPQRDIESANRYGLEKFAAGAAAGEGQPGARRAERRARPTPRASRPGQEATLQLLAKALEKFGVTVIDPAGRALRSGAPRGDDGPGIGDRRAELGPAGGAARATSSTGGCCGRPGSSSRRSPARALKAPRSHPYEVALECPSF